MDEMTTRERMTCVYEHREPDRVPIADSAWPSTLVRWRREGLPDEVSFVTIDASFISLKVLLPVVRGWFGPEGGRVIALIKPQFEAGREQASRGRGVIKDPKVHRSVLKEVLGFAQSEGYAVLGLERSPVKGPKGNIEFLAYLGWPGKETTALGPLIARVA